MYFKNQVKIKKFSFVRKCNQAVKTFFHLLIIKFTLVEGGFSTQIMQPLRQNAWLPHGASGK